MHYLLLLIVDIPLSGLGNPQNNLYLNNILDLIFFVLLLQSAECRLQSVITNQYSHYSLVNDAQRNERSLQNFIFSIVSYIRIY